MSVDPAVLELLQLGSSAQTTISPIGHGSSKASTFTISARLADDGSEKKFFLKTLATADGPLLVEGEHASLKAIYSALPNFCPQPLGKGTFQSSPSTSFLVTEFMELSTSASPLLSGFFETFSPRRGLAQKLATLHQSPAPIPEGFTKPQFGFPVTTCCGDTPQDNSFKESWAEFYSENRLRFILGRCEASQGPDPTLRNLIQATINTVVPKLIGDDHLNKGEKITPVLVHGDLWCGNAGRARIAGRPVEDVIFDPSAFYAHSEYELAIMSIFGGFSKAFFAEYHKLCPKTEPIEEYDDRISLYEIYHYLNHLAIFGDKRKYHWFGGRYRSMAMGIMERLLQKYEN